MTSDAAAHGAASSSDPRAASRTSDLVSNAASACILAPDLSPRSGGIHEAILGQARALSATGRGLTLISAQAPGQRPDPALGLNLRTVKGTGPLARSRVPGLTKTLDDTEARVVHLHGMWLPALSTSARRWRQARTDRALVLSPHGMLDPWALGNSCWKKRLAMALFERATLRACDCLHALNPAEAAAIRAQGLNRPIAVIPNGVNLPEQSRPLATFPNRPAPTDVADPRRVMLFLGRLHPKKGVAETLRAWSRLSPALHADWRLVIAGWDDGGHGETLTALATELKLDREVTFAGAVFGADKYAWLARASGFVLASYSEGLPMAVLEAWAHRVPVFMSAACNLPEGFSSGAAIEVVPDPQRLAATLAEHLARPDLDDVGQAGRALVDARFTWDSIGQQLDRLYGWLLGETADRPDWIHLP